MVHDSSVTGYLSEEELRGAPGIPTLERRRKGPVACIECLQDIPCNPCETSCKFGAIIVGEDITGIPHLQAGKCVACRTCVYICPGQAIFLIDESLPAGRASVMMPYEYLPLPQEGDIVTALNRAGQELGDARVLAVRQSKKMDQTATVNIEVPTDWSMQARAIRLKGN